MRLLPATLAIALLSCAAPPPAPEPPLTCQPSSRWRPGTRAFVERTREWGLDALGVQGHRFSVADIDRDGWPDLAVRAVGVRSDGTDGVRHHWLLRNTGKGTFEDVTRASGILTPRGTGVTGGRPGEVWVFGDVDADGDVDAYTGLDTSNPASQGETSELMLNDGRGRFAHGPATSALRRAGSLDNPGGAAFLDYDLDGHLDLWAPQNNSGSTFLQSRLYKGDGTGAFVDATDVAGLTTANWTSTAAIDEGRAHARAWAAAACDLNNDGFPELLTASYGRAPNHLFQGANTPDGVRYANRSVASGYAYDENRGYQDNENFRCWCQQNSAKAACRDVPAPRISCGNGWNAGADELPFRNGGNSATTTCADLDNDGDVDLVTGEIKHWWAGEGSDEAEVLVNTGEPDVRFVRPGRAAMGIEVPRTDPGGWNEGIMTGTVFDFDNDGWPDLYWGMSDYGGNHGLLLHQVSALRFETVPVEDGIDHHRSHGVAVADFDRDGDLDVVVGHSRARCDPRAPSDCYDTPQARFFENVQGQAGNWVQLELEGGPGTNRSAIGARVTLTTPDGLTQTQLVGGGYGHFGAQNEHALHFGLGAACEAEATIHWPNFKATQRLRVTTGRRFLVREGEPPAASVPAR